MNNITSLNNLPEFSHISIQKVENGFIVKVERAESEEVKVFTSGINLSEFINRLTASTIRPEELREG